MDWCQSYLTSCRNPPTSIYVIQYHLTEPIVNIKYVIMDNISIRDNTRRIDSYSMKLTDAMSVLPHFYIYTFTFILN